MDLCYALKHKVGLQIAPRGEAILRPVYFAIIVVTVILVDLGSGWVSRSDAYEHHGFKVDPMGSHDECLSCHNGYISDYHIQCIPNYFLGLSHPQIQKYPPPKLKNEFKPVEVAEKMGIFFVDGKIDCISCHSLRAVNRYHLRIDASDKQLCYACHIKLGEVWGR